MKLPTVRRSTRSDIDMVPMINFAFLLLIFFMLAGTLVPAQKIPIDPPRSALATPADPSGNVLIIAADGRAGFAGELMPEAALPARIAQWHKEHPQEPLRVKADAAVDAAQVIRILQSLRASGIEHVGLLTARGKP
jgi:biopolymer transport protein ExbD